MSHQDTNFRSLRAHGDGAFVLRQQTSQSLEELGIVAAAEMEETIKNTHKCQDNSQVVPCAN
eukprot:3518465-Amphidinium_carterae.1